jgi:hypothetical protein
VYKVKGLNDSSRGVRKGQSDVLTKLAGMTQGVISTPRADDSGGTRQLGKDIGAEVAKATMPYGRGSSGSQGVRDNTWSGGGQSMKR